MKQKKIIIILVIMCLLLTIGCTKSNFIGLKKNKPSISYYTDEIISTFDSTNCEIQLLSTDFYKTVKLTEGEILIMRKFFKYLPSKNYIKNPLSKDQSPKYKLFINFKGNNKYVMDVYNEMAVTLYPWDGIYEKDFFTMGDTYTSYNLYYLCDYIMGNSK